MSSRKCGPQKCDFLRISEFWQGIHPKKSLFSLCVASDVSMTQLPPKITEFEWKTRKVAKPLKTRNTISMVMRTVINKITILE